MALMWKDILSDWIWWKNAVLCMCASRLPRYGSLSHLFIHKCSLCPTEQRLVKREKGYQSKSFFSSSLSLSLSLSLLYYKK